MPLRQQSLHSLIGYPPGILTGSQHRNDRHNCLSNIMSETDLANAIHPENCFRGSIAREFDR